MTTSAGTPAAGPPVDQAPPPPGLVARAQLGLIAAYQRLSAHRPPACRYWPSCSEYAADAIARHGPWRGLAMTARRLARCHPWGGHGPDPVPE